MVKVELRDNETIDLVIDDINYSIIKTYVGFKITKNHYNSMVSKQTNNHNILIDTGDEQTPDY